MKKWTILTSLALAGLTAPAFGDQIELRFLGLKEGGLTVRVTNDGNALDTRAGRFDWRIVNTTRELSTFCTELDEGISGNPHTFDIVPVATLPNTLSGGMGQLRADLIGELYDNHYEDAVNFDGGGGGLTDNQQAAAFQLAIWEIVYENALDDGYTQGELGVSSGDGSLFASNIAAAVITAANTWLDELTGTLDPNGQYHALLRGLLNDGTQDQLLIIPLPPAAALAALGLLGIVVGRRKLRRL